MRPTGFSQSTTFIGLYVAKVTDRDDSSNLGRVQVKVKGIHTSDTGLPWALPLQPLIGTKQYTVPDVGTWVWVLFVNGNPVQPVYLGQVRSEELGEATKTQEVFGFEVEDGDDTVEFKIDRQTKEITLGISSDAWLVKIRGGSIQIGMGTFRKLLNEIAGSIFNGHTHNIIGVQSGATSKSTTGPNQSIKSSAQTDDLEAS